MSTQGHVSFCKCHPRSLITYRSTAEEATVEQGSGRSQPRSARLRVARASGPASTGPARMPMMLVGSLAKRPCRLAASYESHPRATISLSCPSTSRPFGELLSCCIHRCSGPDSPRASRAVLASHRAITRGHRAAKTPSTQANRPTTLDYGTLRTLLMRGPERSHTTFFRCK